MWQKKGELLLELSGSGSSLHVMARNKLEASETKKKSWVEGDTWEHKLLHLCENANLIPVD